MFVVVSPPELACVDCVVVSLPGPASSAETTLLVSRRAAIAISLPDLIFLTLFVGVGRIADVLDEL